MDSADCTHGLFIIPLRLDDEIQPGDRLVDKLLQALANHQLQLMLW
jgi:hypothetical protein